MALTWRRTTGPAPTAVFPNNWSTKGNVNPYTGEMGSKTEAGQKRHGYSPPASNPPALRRPSLLERYEAAIDQSRETSLGRTTSTSPAPLTGAARSAPSATPLTHQHLPSGQRDVPSRSAYRVAPDSPASPVAPSSTERSVPRRENVLEAQRYLSYFGFDIGAIDGLIGPRTRAAMHAYQRERRLSPTEEVSKALLDRMALEINRANRVNTEKRTRVARSRLTERTQFYLRVIGLYSGEANGVPDTPLQQAVMRFQSANRLSVDGELSDDLLAQIKSKVFD